MNKKSKLKNSVNKTIIHKSSSSGITLITLSVTIIIMLILAAVTIMTLTKEEGIVSKARKAVIETEKQEIEELIKLGYVYKNMASLKTISQLDVKESSIAIFENLTSNGFHLLKTDGNIAESASDIYVLESNSINLDVEGKHAYYIGTVTNTGLQGNLKVIEDLSDKPVQPIEPVQPEGQPYSFKLNDLGEWKIGTEGWISFDLNLIWEKIGENLYEDSNYIIDSGQTGNWLLAVGSDNEKMANGIKIMLGDQNELEKEFSIVGHIMESFPNELLLQVTNTSFEEILSESEAENKITYEKFMNDYGNTTFYFMTKEEVGFNF